MDHVTTPLAYGTYHPYGASSVDHPVNYLIFELADGDIRRHLATAQNIELAWKLRTAHHVAVGLRQLHASNIAHQDLKPSNILTFNTSTAKVADLGRAIQLGIPVKHDKFTIAGDPTYAPIEALYYFVPSDWDTRRKGSDLFHLGNILAFLFGLSNVNSAIISKLLASHRPTQWMGTYQDVLPYLKHAFSACLIDIESGLKSSGPAPADKIVKLIEELCDPNPHRRGHRGVSGDSARLSLESYVSHLDLLARRAEIFGARR